MVYPQFFLSSLFWHYTDYTAIFFYRLLSTREDRKGWFGGDVEGIRHRAGCLIEDTYLFDSFFSYFSIKFCSVGQNYAV